MAPRYTEINHYVYKIEFETGHVYFGVRSCRCLPEDDTYLGSPYTHKSFWEEQEPKKTVLRVFDTREEAVEHETILIDWSWSINRGLSLNCHNRNHFNFKSHKHTEACKKQISEKLKGRKRSPEVVEKIREAHSKPFTLVSPEGKLINSKNLSEFCRQNKLLRRDIQNLIKGEVLQSKGWTTSLAAHNLYTQYFQKRGIAVCGERWVVKTKKAGKKVYNYFKSYEEALEFRDSMLQEGFEFVVRPLKWKEKLAEMQE